MGSNKLHCSDTPTISGMIKNQPKRDNKGLANIANGLETIPNKIALPSKCMDTTMAKIDSVMQVSVFPG